MPSAEVTLVAGVTSIFPLDAPTGRIVVTQLSGTAAVIGVTADGSLPVVPGTGAEINDSQVTLAAVLGVRGVITPPLYTTPGAAGPTGRLVPTLRLLSAGAPTVNIAW